MFSIFFFFFFCFAFGKVYSPFVALALILGALRTDVIIVVVVLSVYRMTKQTKSETDGQTDGQTEGRIDQWTDAVRKRCISAAKKMYFSFIFERAAKNEKRKRGKEGKRRSVCHATQNSSALPIGAPQNSCNLCALQLAKEFQFFLSFFFVSCHCFPFPSAKTSFRQQGGNAKFIKVNWNY